MMKSEGRTAWGLGVGLVLLAFVAAMITQGWGLLSLTPPPSEAIPNPAPDVAEGATLALYQAAYTAWAALLLLIPAYLLAFGCAQAWLAFWTVSFMAYAVHIAVSAFGFFGGDFEWMTNTTRVSAFWPGMALLIWWPIDLILGYKGVQGRFVTIQRIVLHIVVLVLFVGGSAVMGELMVAKLMGWALLACALFALVRWRTAR